MISLIVLNLGSISLISPELYKNFNNGYIQLSSTFCTLMNSTIISIESSRASASYLNIKNKDFMSDKRQSREMVSFLAIETFNSYKISVQLKSKIMSHASSIKVCLKFYSRLRTTLRVISFKDTRIVLKLIRRRVLTQS